MVFLGALGAMDGVGGEIPRAIDEQQVMPIEIGKSLHYLAALQPTKQRLVQRAQLGGIHLV
jgi:hypothetical protein